MSRAERLALVDRADPALSAMEQCRLLKVARSTLYYRPAPVSADDLAVMRRMCCVSTSGSCGGKPMNALTTNLAVAAFVFAGGMIGLHLHRLLPERPTLKRDPGCHQAWYGNAIYPCVFVLGLMISNCQYILQFHKHDRARIRG